jgi:hypothetical protein
VIRENRVSEENVALKDRKARGDEQETEALKAPKAIPVLPCLENVIIVNLSLEWIELVKSSANRSVKQVLCAEQQAAAAPPPP